MEHLLGDSRLNNLFFLENAGVILSNHSTTHTHREKKWKKKKSRSPHSAVGLHLIFVDFSFVCPRYDPVVGHLSLIFSGVSEFFFIPSYFSQLRLFFFCLSWQKHFCVL